MKFDFMKWGFSLSVILLLGLVSTGIGAGTHKLATFAGGCFWCMEEPFEEMEGVVVVVSGYTGGIERNPTYKQVSAGETSHLQALQVSFDPEEVSYHELLEVFWRQIDATDGGGQFTERGKQYRTAIFYHNATQERMARESKERLASAGVFGGPIVTEILKAGEFYKAESDHQDYYKKNPNQYKSYRVKSGRDEYLKRIWKRVELQFD